MSPFAKQTTLVADGSSPGRYRVEVEPRWNCPIVPQGGIIAALAARAMALELGDSSQRLRTLTTVFAAQVPSGPVTVDVTVLRRGRSMSQAMADVRAPGADAGHTSVAVFGQSRPGFEFTDVRMPDVPPPHDCPSFRDPLPPEAGEFERRPVFPFWDSVEGRPAMVHAPWDDYVPASSECARMGPGTPMWYPPSADLTVHLLGEARSEWLLAHLRARRASEGYVSVEAAMWDQSGQLVAHAAQVMFLSFPDGPPSPVQRVPFDHRVPFDQR